MSKIVTCLIVMACGYFFSKVAALPMLIITTLQAFLVPVILSVLHIQGRRMLIICISSRPELSISQLFSLTMNKVIVPTPV